MPRGRSQRRGGGGRKGCNRHFTNMAELEAEEEKNKRMNAWRKQKGELPSDSDEENSGSGSGSESEGEEASGIDPRDSQAARVPGLDSSSEDSDGEEKHSGVSHLIEVENPNRMKNKQSRKVGELDKNATVQLSRREREELEKQRAAAHYQKLHLAGKTEEAQSDLARLALIRKQRAEAAAKREEEKAAKEAAVKASEQKLKEKRKTDRAK